MTEQTNAQVPAFDILRIYTKDTSLETPNSPAIFREQWRPRINVEFDTKLKDAGKDEFEVDLRVTVTCNNVLKTEKAVNPQTGKEEEKVVEEHVAFIAETHTSGVFLVRNVDNNTADYLLNASCPNILFPYARETIASLVNRGTFPTLNLRPLNFEAMYRARKMQEAAQAKKAAGEAAEEKKD